MALGKDIFELDQKIKRLYSLMEEAELIANMIKNIDINSEEIEDVAGLKAELTEIQKEMGVLSIEVFEQNKAGIVFDRYAILKASIEAEIGEHEKSVKNIKHTIASKNAILDVFSRKIKYTLEAMGGKATTEEGRKLSLRASKSVYIPDSLESDELKTKFLIEYPSLMNIKKVVTYSKTNIKEALIKLQNDTKLEMQAEGHDKEEIEEVVKSIEIEGIKFQENKTLTIK